VRIWRGQFPPAPTGAAQNRVKPFIFCNFLWELRRALLRVVFGFHTNPLLRVWPHS
jgi:hypothetical protein